MYWDKKRGPREKPDSSATGFPHILLLRKSGCAVREVGGIGRSGKTWLAKSTASRFSRFPRKPCPTRERYQQTSGEHGSGAPSGRGLAQNERVCDVTGKKNPLLRAGFLRFFESRGSAVVRDTRDRTN